MGRKFGAVVWTLITVVIAITGFRGYSSADYSMEWFGIDLSKGGFTILMLIFLVIDIISLYHAFTAEKKMAAEQQKNLSEFEKNVENEQLEAPCLISLKRSSNIIGSATGFNVYLNYRKIGVLKNGKTLEFYTSDRYNVLTGDGSNGPVKEPLSFEAISGGSLSINYKSTKNRFEWGDGSGA